MTEMILSRLGGRIGGSGPTTHRRCRGRPLRLSRWVIGERRETLGVQRCRVLCCIGGGGVGGSNPGGGECLFADVSARACRGESKMLV